MGKYDDFNLDLKKAGIKENGEKGTGTITTVTTVKTLATECFTFDGSNTCNCPSTDCSPCDMSTSCRRENEQIFRC